jgi:hypothetical protein
MFRHVHALEHIARGLVNRPICGDPTRPPDLAVAAFAMQPAQTVCAVHDGLRARSDRVWHVHRLVARVRNRCIRASEPWHRERGVAFVLLPEAKAVQMLLHTSHSQLSGQRTQANGRKGKLTDHEPVVSDGCAGHVDGSLSLWSQRIVLALVCGIFASARRRSQQAKRHS